MKRTWSPAQIDLLKEKYPVSTPAQLAELFPDKTKSAIKTKANTLGVRKAKQRFRFTDEQIEFLKANYHNTLNRDLADYFGCSIHSVENKSYQLGLKKERGLIAETARKNMERPDHPGRKHWIKKGTAPVNKGKKQAEYMTQEAIERTKATRFKKGQKAWNRKPVGHERINTDGYVEIKTAQPNKFELKHRVIWRRHHGKIPHGHNVQFRDGNPQNLAIENLYLISRRDQFMKENSMYARYPKDVQLAIQMKGALNRQINKLKATAPNPRQLTGKVTERNIRKLN